MRFVALALALTLSGRLVAADSSDEDADDLRPGLVAQYFLGDPQPHAAFIRPEVTPTYLLGAGMAPDPRLPGKGWSVRWTGLIKAPKTGAYRFSAEHSGPTEIRIGDEHKLALAEKDAAGEPKPGEPIAMKFGLTPIEIKFQSPGEGARLKLYWQSDDLAREQIPPQALGHTATSLKSEGLAAIDDSFFRGRLAVEEHSCAACHAPGNNPMFRELQTRRGPKLTDAPERLKAAWIVRWLADPQAMRRDAVMPRLFSSDKAGELERFAVALYLTHPTKAHPALADADKSDAKAASEALAADGKRLFNQTGCLACHPGTKESPARAALPNERQKTTLAALAADLQDPLAHNPAGRMPSLNLSKGEAEKLAAYLWRQEPGEAPLALPSEAPEEQTVLNRMLDMGRTVLEKKNCAACHEFTPDGAQKPLEAKRAGHDLAAVTKALGEGRAPEALACLAPATTACDGAAPRFGVELYRPAVLEFLRSGINAPATPAPSETARLTLARFNCLACHQRDGDGGLTQAVVQALAENQTPEMAEQVQPPQLTGVTEKLLAGYIKAVLQDGRRSRPWMTLRMPQFPKDQTAGLPACLAALDGAALQTEPYHLAGLTPDQDKQFAEAGRRLVGAKGFGCTKCHDMLGVPSGGTRGPDLSLVGERVNFAWFDRWMTDPQRIQPGTRMPTVFLNGASPYKDVLGGDPAKQRQAIWHYLLSSKSLGPPEGLETAKPSDVAASAEPYQTLRAFLPDVTPRSIAIRGADGVHLVYDLQMCRLAYAWSGEFLNLQPVWGDRGGNRAGIRGTIFWRSPPGFPWDVTMSAGAPPDFSKRGSDTTLGAELPQDGKLYPTRLDFKGYHLDEDGPTFRYELKLEPQPNKAFFTERVVALHGEAANGVSRTATVAAPVGQTVWLQVAVTDKPPEWRAADGAGGVLDGPEKSAPAGAVVTCVQQSKPLVFHLRTAPGEGAWLANRVGGNWSLALRFPATGEVAAANLKLVELTPVSEGQTAGVVAGEMGKK